MELWETSGHSANYKENMFVFEVSTWYEHIAAGVLDGRRCPVKEGTGRWILGFLACFIHLAKSLHRERCVKTRF